jgi:hypothetical protein
MPVPLFKKDKGATRGAVSHTHSIHIFITTYARRLHLESLPRPI